MVAANGFVGSMVVLLHLSSADVFYKKVSKDILDKTDQRGAKIACRKLLVKTHWLWKKSIGGRRKHSVWKSLNKSHFAREVKNVHIWIYRQKWFIFHFRFHCFRSQWRKNCKKETFFGDFQPLWAFFSKYKAANFIKLLRRNTKW